MLEKNQCVKIGFIQKPHGVKGELSLTLNDGVFSEDFNAKFLLLDIDNGLVPFYMESVRVKGSKSILVKLEGVDIETKAKDLCGCEAYVESEAYEGAEDLPNNAFVGFKVIDEQKGNIGVITEIQEISNNPLFVLDFEGTEILFPVNQDLILGVDEKNKVMNVDLPEGLIDLYLDNEPDSDDLDDEDWEQEEE